MLKAKSLLVFILFFIAYTTATAQSKYPSILWEIKKTKTSKPSYLFGTYHISSKGVFKLGDSIFYALKNVDIVAKEVNVNTWQKEEDAVEKMQFDYARYTNQLRKAEFSKNVINKTNTIEKLPFFISSQPNYINYFLSRSSESSDGFEEEMFLDKFISSAGFKYGKELKGLENYKESNLLYLEGQKDQEDEEKRDQKQLPGDITYKEMYDKIYDGYLNNNLDAMDSFRLYQYESEAFYNKFLKQRNYNQADSMDYYIKTGKTIFAAVGAAHLPGDDGVIEIMRKKGYKVRPVKLKFTNTNELEAVKKMTIPLINKQQNIDNIIGVKAPGEFYVYEKTDILKSYGYVDMSNNAYYHISRLYNNAAYFNYDGKKISLAIDSLLYSNIKGDIIDKSFSELDGYSCVNVTAKVKNKDIERYKFVITPYEIFKFQAGGKNDFAKTNFVDEFFNSIKIIAPQRLSDNYSFRFKNDYPIHIWNTSGINYIKSKQRFTNYDAANKQLNGCIKIVLPQGKKITDSLISHLIRESFLGSEIFPKGYLYDNTKLPIAADQINKLNLTTGQMMLVKYKINYPFVYLLSSIKKENPSPDFINSFELKDYTLSNKIQFVDSGKGFKTMLPYAINIDSDWKKQNERKKKIYEDEKSPNENENIFYRPKMYGEDATTDDYTFEDDVNLETIDLRINSFGNDSYFTTASQFWKKIIDPYTESDFTSIADYDDYDYSGSRKKTRSTTKNRYALAQKENNNFYTLNNGDADDVENNYKIENLVYDTANNNIQSVQFYYLDTIKKTKTFHQYKLTNNMLYHLTFEQFNKEKTAFQKMVSESFTPLQTNKTITIYKSNFDEILNEYVKANLQKRPNVLKRLNSIFLGIKELKTVDAVFKKYNKNVPEENILRRKLMDMVGEGLYESKDWPTVSSWFQKIYSNENELVTLRNFALSSIITKFDSTDATWLVDNLYNKNNMFQKSVSGIMNTYLANANNKAILKPIVPLIFDNKDKLSNLNLIDSGYFTNAEKLKAFEVYKAILEEEVLDIKLSQEKANFEFKESEINETLTNEDGGSEFGQLVTAFEYFYNVNPTDAFFNDALKKIMAANANTDLISILNVFLKQPKPDYTLVDKIVKQVGKENDNLISLNQAFFTHKKYDKLPAQYKDKKLLAKYYLLNESNYDKLDSIIFISAEKYTYSATDSIYFFKYISVKEKNANIAYVKLDNNNLFLDDDVNTTFTKEQITKTEPFDKIKKKLMQQIFTSDYFYGSERFYNYNNNNKCVFSEE